MNRDLPASGICISNRHPCRLESRVNPSAPTKSFFLIVTKSRANFFAFSSHFSASPRLCGRNIPMCGPDALARGLRQSFPRRSRHSCLLISNRNIPLLDTSVSACKHVTSLFLIATLSLLLRFAAPSFLHGLPPVPSSPCEIAPCDDSARVSAEGVTGLQHVDFEVGDVVGGGAEGFGAARKNRK